MKKKFWNNLILLASFALFMAACGSSNNTSRLTGWQYNDPDGTGFEVQRNFRMSTPSGMVKIEGGTVTIGERAEFVTAPRNNPRRRITVSSFYMDQYEVRNIDWREYTHWLSIVFGNTAPAIVERAQPNKTIWREALAYNEPYIQFYFTHPSYDQYPIVGVTWEQAMDFCSWRTDRVNERALVLAGVMERIDYRAVQEETDFQTIINDFVFNTQKYLLQDSYQPVEGRRPRTDLFGNPRKATMSDGILITDFRLPTEAEWEYAALGMTADQNGFVDEGRAFPWSGDQMRNTSKRMQGQMMANFVRGRGDMMGTAGDLNDGGVITMAVGSFPPNDFGLYDMAGNVNEWVLDVFRPTSFEDVAEYNSFRGNVYMEPVITGTDENGRPQFAVDSLGRIRMQVTVDGDMRNFRDGDPTSQLFTDFMLENFWEGMENLTDREDVQIDITDILAPRITDKTRVYKGGSWKDRAFWLNPSTRRFLDQDQSANDIGFRCALSLVGSETPSRRR
jgi:gliding motility-associated lipoprotein GldJ